MEAWRAYILTSRRLMELLEQALDGHDLSMADYEVLAQLSDAPERRMRMSELAQAALLSRSRLSHRMKVMEQAGLIRKEECPDDRRGAFAVMTEKGWQAIVAAAPDHVASVRQAFTDVLTPEDQKVIARSFTKIQGLLKSDTCC
jgi:DNA-binding MarR family transcriptional regulator